MATLLMQQEFYCLNLNNKEHIYVISTYQKRIKHILVIFLSEKKQNGAYVKQKPALPIMF